MSAIRALFHKHGLLETSANEALGVAGLDPWTLRAEGLDRLLSPQELATALGHIARHRGFRSNAKRDRGANASSDSSAMLKAIDATREKLSQWRTVGEMMAHSPEFAGRKRNRSGDYSRTVLRLDQEAEVAMLLERQQMLGNPQATPDLQEAFSDLAFSQRPLQSSESLVGQCPFEPDQKRAAKKSPSFERFRYLARLTSLRLVTGRTERAFTEEELEKAVAGFGDKAKITFKSLRKTLGLDANTRFAGVAPEDETRDVAARLGAAAEGTAALRKVIAGQCGEAVWQSLFALGEPLDRIAAAITFREEPDDIRAGIAEAGVPIEVVDAVMAGLDEGAFSSFKGAGHISAKACRAMMPWLARGLVYSDAATQAGYDHTARPVTSIEDIGSPVARKALSETLKQIKTVSHEFGPFDRIHVELARDVGKSAEERSKLERGIDDRTREKDKAREELKALLKVADVSGEDLLRYELWKEQGGRCLYTDEAISPDAILASNNLVQVDHILPWSRFGDDSYINKTLCLTQANQHKKGRTPYEWFMADKTEDWDRFVARVEALSIKGRKKRSYLLKNAAEVEEKFRSRNLNDTRYATRVLMQELTRLYPANEGERRVFARPGELTSKLRRAWGLESLKKNDNGERLPDDRHHALDAIVVASTTESQLQRLTRAFQEAERLGKKREFRGLPEPWTGFRDQAKDAHQAIIVSRAEVRRARGKAHDATIKQVRERDGQPIVFERKAIEKVSEKDLTLIKDADRNAAVVEALRSWIASGRPKDALPLSPKGDVIRKVRVGTTAKVAVPVRGGTADRGEMVRVDVFTKSNAKGVRQYFLVPVYPHDVVTRQAPPDRAVQGGGDISKWPVVDDTYEFIWSIYPMSLLEITKPDGEVIKGYFRGLDRNTGALTVSDVSDSSSTRKGIGVRTALGFRKLSVDRLGRVSEVRSETRTWRGKVCI
jgi:CRISPR-associated endonuclease Csn1